MKMPIHSEYTEAIQKQRDDADGHSHFLSKCERKLRHQSRTENRKALPRVKEGKLLGDSGDENGERDIDRRTTRFWTLTRLQEVRSRASKSG
jgi:hypothetical protein